MKVLASIAVIDLRTPVSSFSLLSNAFTEEILSRSRHLSSGYPLFGLAHMLPGEAAGASYPTDIDLSLQLKFVTEIARAENAKAEGSSKASRVSPLTARLLALLERRAEKEAKLTHLRERLINAAAPGNIAGGIDQVVAKIFAEGGNTSDFALKIAQTLTSYSFRGSVMTSAHAMQVAGALANRVFDARRYTSAFSLKLASTLASQIFRKNRLTSSQISQIANTIASYVFAVRGADAFDALRMAGKLTERVIREKESRTVSVVKERDNYHQDIYHQDSNYQDNYHTNIHHQDIEQAASVLTASQTRELVRLVSSLPAMPAVSLTVREARPSSKSPAATQIEQSDLAYSQTIRETPSLPSHPAREDAPHPNSALHMTNIFAAKMLGSDRLTSAQSFALANTLISKIMAGDRLTAAQSYRLSSSLTNKIMEGDRLTASQSYNISNSLTQKVMAGDRLTASQSYNISHSLTRKVMAGDRLSAGQSYNVTNALTSAVAQGDRLSSSQTFQTLNAWLAIIFGRVNIGARRLAELFTGAPPPRLRLGAAYSAASQGMRPRQGEADSLWMAPGYAGSRQSSQRQQMPPPQMDYQESAGKDHKPASRMTGSEVRVLANRVYDVIEERITRERRRLGV